MRLWTLHPKYLDKAGLVAAWREALLAKKVLKGETKGYRNHPQLDRFKHAYSPIKAVNNFLLEIYKEAQSRGYNFDKKKVGPVSDKPVKVKVTNGQLQYEFSHLLKKLEKRDILEYNRVIRDGLAGIRPHPIFKITEGDIEDWERA